MLIPSPRAPLPSGEGNFEVQIDCQAFARESLMRLLPRSLLGRLVLVLLGGLIFAQLVSFAIHMHERGELLAQASGMRSAQRIADTVKLLDTLTPAERRRIVQIFSAPPVALSLDEAPFPDESEAA